VLFVSHDRYFIDGLATRVFEVEERRVHVYPGNYEDYLWRKQGGPEKVIDSITKSAVSVTVPVAYVPPPVAEPEKPTVKRLNPIKLKQMEDRLKFAEEEIPRLEEAIATAEAKLGVFASAEESQRVAAELDRLRVSHAGVVAEWEELALELEEQRA
jgi:ATP-binding cassette subfamily F protein 3